MKVTITVSAGAFVAILGYLFWLVGQKTSTLDHVASSGSAPLAMVSLRGNLSQNAQIGKLVLRQNARVTTAQMQQAPKG